MACTQDRLTISWLDKIPSLTLPRQRFLTLQHIKMFNGLLQSIRAKNLFSLTVLNLLSMQSLNEKVQTKQRAYMQNKVSKGYWFKSGLNTCQNTTTNHQSLLVHESLATSEKCWAPVFVLVGSPPTEFKPNLHRLSGRRLLLLLYLYSYFDPTHRSPAVALSRAKVRCSGGDINMESHLKALPPVLGFYCEGNSLFN